MEISEESWFNVSWVDNLKLRGSWGLLGNQDTVSSNYPYQTTYEYGYDYSFGNTLYPGISIATHSCQNFEPHFTASRPVKKAAKI